MNQESINTLRQEVLETLAWFDRRRMGWAGPMRELLDTESFLSEAERGIMPQRNTDNCTNPYFAECLPLCGDAAKEAK